MDDVEEPGEKVKDEEPGAEGGKVKDEEPKGKVQAEGSGASEETEGHVVKVETGEPGAEVKDEEPGAEGGKEKNEESKGKVKYEEPGAEGGIPAGDLKLRHHSHCHRPARPFSLNHQLCRRRRGHASAIQTRPNSQREIRSS